MASSTTTTKTKEETKPRTLEQMSDIIDQDTFGQILEMDEEDDQDFSKGIVYGFFDQAETTFESMQKALKEKNLGELSSLGHFLKGSSATIGLIKVRDACEKIQHYGASKDETGNHDEPDKEKSLEAIEKTLKTVKEDYAEVETFFRNDYYKDPKKEEPTKSEPEPPKEKKEDS